VNTPGVVQLRGTRNLMEVIGMAGGLKPDAGDRVLITRTPNQGSIPAAGALVDATGKYSVAQVDILYVPNSMGKVISARGVETAIRLGTGFAIWR